MPGMQAQFTVHKRDDVSVVQLNDRKIIDEFKIQQLSERLLELADAEPDPKILLDFSNVEHLSSAALSVLITLNKKVKENGGQLALANIHPQNYEVFKITKLNRLFAIFDHTDEAMESLA